MEKCTFEFAVVFYFNRKMQYNLDAVEVFLTVNRSPFVHFETLEGCFFKSSLRSDNKYFVSDVGLALELAFIGLQ